MENVIIVFFLITMVQSSLGALYLLYLLRQPIQRIDNLTVAWIGISYNILWGWYYGELLGKLIVIAIIISWIVIALYYVGGVFNMLPESIKNIKKMYLLDCYNDNYEAVKNNLLAEYTGITIHEKYRNLFFVEEIVKPTDDFSKKFKINR